MLKEFDILPLESGRGYELVSGHEAYVVEFEDEPQLRELFEAFAFAEGSTKSIVAAMTSKFGKVVVQDFVRKLRDANIVRSTNIGSDTVEGSASAAEYRSHRNELLRSKRVLFYGTRKYFELLSNFEWLDEVRFIEAAVSVDEGTLSRHMEDADFAFVDATSYNPIALNLFNGLALSIKLPWMLFQGCCGSAGHVGPIFFGRSTGCYECFTMRHRSNSLQIGTFDRHQAWLATNGRMATPVDVPSGAVDTLFLAIAVADMERFLVDDDLAQSFGVLLEVDVRSYEVSQHRLLPVPLCDACQPRLEHRFSPWLDAITLGQGLPGAGDDSNSARRRRAVPGGYTRHSAGVTE